MPLPYTRSLIQSLLIRYSEILGGLQVKDILLDDLSELCHPPSTLLDPVNHTAEAPQSPRYQIAKRMDWFVDRAGRAYLELYRTLIHNRSRLRRVLCKAVLDWDSLQVEAEEVDSELREFTGEKVLQTEAGMAYSFPLSSWVYFHKLRIMEWIVLLGFELEVFPPGELGGMYWYLQYYLHTRISHVARIRTFVARSPQPDGEAGTLYARTLALLNFYLLEAAAMQDLAMAMVYLYAVLGRWNLLGPGVRPGVGSEILRYEGRMKPVRSIGCPEVVEYEYFRTVVDNPDVPVPPLSSLLPRPR